MIEVTAPNYYNPYKGFKIFLAGSIEMGLAEHWQTAFINSYRGWSDELIVLNPRRDDWDSSWEQSIDNPQFKQQVEWELLGLQNADLVVFCFDPNTKSPITLMELGIMTNRHKKAVVYCPDGFWRKGNVDIVCDMYNIQQVYTFRQLIEHIDSVAIAALSKGLK